MCITWINADVSVSSNKFISLCKWIFKVNFCIRELHCVTKYVCDAQKALCNQRKSYAKICQRHVQRVHSTWVASLGKMAICSEWKWIYVSDMFGEENAYELKNEPMICCKIFSPVSFNWIILLLNGSPKKKYHFFVFIVVGLELCYETFQFCISHKLPHFTFVPIKFTCPN